MNTCPHVSNRVRHIRKRLHMRQEDLARAVGVSRQTIIAIEKGRMQNPGIHTCLMLAQALGVPVERIFYMDAKPALAPEGVSEGADAFSLRRQTSRFDPLYGESFRSAQDFAAPGRSYSS